MFFAPDKVRIGFDTETYLIQPGLLAPRCVCVTLSGQGEPPAAVTRSSSVVVSDHDSGWGALLGRKAGAGALLATLQRPEVNLVAHNAAFDVAVACRLLEEELGVDLFHGLDKAGAPLGFGVFDLYDPEAENCATIYDTQIREQLLAIAEDRYKFDHRTGKPARFNLAALVLSYFGIDLSPVKKGDDVWRLRYNELDGVPVGQWPLDAQTYAVDDATWALRVAVRQSKAMNHDGGGVLVDSQGHVTDEYQQTAAAFALHLCAIWGVRTDGPMVSDFAAETERAVEEAQEAGRRAGFLRKNGSRDMKKLYAIVSKAYGGVPPRNAPTGRFPEGSIKTDADTLRDSGSPDLIAYAEGSIHRTTQQRYLPQLQLGTDHAMTSSPRPLKRTGRCAWSDPNQHNPPRRGRYRECHLARPGYLYGSADWSGAELRALAQICLWWFDHSKMAEAFQVGRDPHMELGAQMLGVSFEEALEHPERKQARQLSKAANFGFPGGLSSPTFVKLCAAQGLDLSRDGTPEDAEAHAEELKQAWFATWPEVRDYLDEISRMAQGGGFTAVQLCSGRARSGCSYTSGANTYFQGLIADIAKASLWRVTREAYSGVRYDAPAGTVWEGGTEPTDSPLHGSRPWLLLHDEILIEAPEDSASAAVQRMAAIMVKTAEAYTPDVPHEAEPALMRRWYKSAEPVWEDGELKPWEPESKE